MSFSNVCAEGELEMEYELRVVVEKVLGCVDELFTFPRVTLQRHFLLTCSEMPPIEPVELVATQGCTSSLIHW
jgi:hypothetical protein